MLKIQELREIIRLIDQSSISEFSYEQDGSSVSIKKSAMNQAEPKIEEIVKDDELPAVPVMEKQENVTKEVPKQPTNEVVSEMMDESDENITEIVSPMVGTFYRKPSPDSDTYVEIGDQVNEDSIVCIVEAMKLFNEIEAETTGEITEILVGDGELVEYGQALFKVKHK